MRKEALHTVLYHVGKGSGLYGAMEGRIGPFLGVATDQFCLVFRRFKSSKS